MLLRCFHGGAKVVLVVLAERMLEGGEGSGGCAGEWHCWWAVDGML